MRMDTNIKASTEIQDKLILLYNNFLNYTITDVVQRLDINFNVEQLQQELLDFLVDNKFGLSQVSLRIPIESSDPIDYTKEKVTEKGLKLLNLHHHIDHLNPTNESEYKYWHPSLKNSLVTKLVSQLEEFSGLPIGRVRLVWLQPGEGYNLHVDVEPLRFHVPLITNSYSYFISNNNLQSMEYGGIYHVITSSTHTAHNFGEFPRLHLLLSTYLNDDISKKIDQLSNDDFIINAFKEHVNNPSITKNSLNKLYRLVDSEYGKSDPKTRDFIRMLAMLTGHKV